MDSYKKVKTSLEQAAKAAGTELGEILELPKMSDYDQAFDIFSCAISPKLIGGNASYKLSLCYFLYSYLTWLGFHAILHGTQLSSPPPTTVLFI